jgi:hypothetical protein
MIAHAALDSGHRTAALWRVHEVRMTRKRPWLFATIGGAGLTLLAAGGFALFAPAPLLERAAASGDARLGALLGAAFVAATGLSRLFLLRRRLLEERVDEPSARAQRYLR